MILGFVLLVIEIRMKVCFYANLRTITNLSNLTLDEAGIDTLRQLIGYLIELYPEMVQQLLDSLGNVRSEVPIFVNGRNPRLEKDGLDIALGSEDVISIFSPIASGRMNVEVMRDAKLSEPR